MRPNNKSDILSRKCVQTFLHVDDCHDSHQHPQVAGFDRWLGIRFMSVMTVVNVAMFARESPVHTTRVHGPWTP